MSISRKFVAALGVAVMLCVAGRSWGSLVGTGDPLGNDGIVIGNDPPFVFTFSSANLSNWNLLGNGNLDVQGNVAQTGSMTVSGPYAGTYSLVSNPSGQEQYTSIFIWDNRVSLGNDPVLDSDGLLFTDGAGRFINVWGNGVGQSYTFCVSDYQQTPVSFQLVPAPLPVSAGVGFSMLAGFGMLFGVRKQLGRRPRIA